MECGGVSRTCICALCKTSFLMPFQTRGGGKTEWVYTRKKGRKKIYYCSYKCFTAAKPEEDKRCVK